MSRTADQVYRTLLREIKAINNVLRGGSGGGGVSDHGALTGLGDDDHSQYLLIDGSRAMTGNLSVGANLVDGVDVSAHAARHQSAGADAIKLDDLAAPDDNTDLNATTSVHGLLPKLPGGSSTFLRADGVFATPGAGGGADVYGVTVGDGVTAITTGTYGDRYCPGAATIIAAVVLADTPGSMTWGVEKATWGASPMSFSSIVASAPPTLTSSSLSRDATLTGWTTSIVAQDILRFKINSVSGGIARAHLFIEVAA